ncbi:hypothetical protein EDC04DRAFT_645236 [Pisolithus marmoratus]|nr:hypothetical protein EDC04DRAFT_645236 [Pisolithus marmoratus]
MAAASVSANPRKLTAAPQPSSSQLNKPARQLVPAFLQKLYEMVNDSENHHLIRWSDTGDSFFVLDQERFASEVLGRWFKHKNFSSFVRQLNMYGFHKIPHLQQGVLRSENETEFWNFEHPHFIRGKPDMLHLIQLNDNAGDTVGLSQNQLVDINSIVNGIQAISRHQAAISTDLNELKASNQRLWQEALVSRERHKKHQDTINCIVRFLASVFGHVEQMRKNDDGHGRTHTVIPRNPQRLMIGDGKHRKGGVEPSEDGSQLVHSPSMSMSLWISRHAANCTRGATCASYACVHRIVRKRCTSSETVTTEQQRCYCPSCIDSSPQFTIPYAEIPSRTEPVHPK